MAKTNDKARALFLARKDAAQAIQWPEQTAVLFNPDRDVIRRRIMVPALIASALLAVVSIGQPALNHWQKAHEENEMRPAMEASLADGTRAAGTWLAIHFAKEHPGLLEQEATAGEPQAMYTMGLVLGSGQARRFFTLDASLSDDQLAANGRELIMKAAAAGNPDALKYAVGKGWALTKQAAAQ